MGRGMLDPMARFLVKTEPSAYSFADLQRDKRTVWDGLSNPAALLHLATIRGGDTIVVYHSGNEKAAVGLAVARTDAYVDPKRNNPTRPVVEFEVVRPFPEPVRLARVKADAVLKNSLLARHSRLSVIPLTEPQFQRLLRLAEEIERKGPARGAPPKG